MTNAQAARRAFEAWLHAVDYTTMPSQWKDGGTMNPITGFWTMAKIDRDALMRDMIDVLRRYGLNEDMATANCICTDGEPSVIVFGTLRWNAVTATDPGTGMVKYIDGVSA